MWISGAVNCASQMRMKNSEEEGACFFFYHTEAKKILKPSSRRITYIPQSLSRSVPSFDLHLQGKVEERAQGLVSDLHTQSQESFIAAKLSKSRKTSGFMLSGVRGKCTVRSLGVSRLPGPPEAQEG